MDMPQDWADGALYFTVSDGPDDEAGYVCAHFSTGHECEGPSYYWQESDGMILSTDECGGTVGVPTTFDGAPGFCLNHMVGFLASTVVRISREQAWYGTYWPTGLPQPTMAEVIAFQG